MGRRGGGGLRAVASLSLCNVAKVHRRLFGIAFAALSPELHSMGRRRRGGGVGGIKQSRQSSLYRQITSKALRYRCCRGVFAFFSAVAICGGRRWGG